MICTSCIHQLGEMYDQIVIFSEEIGVYEKNDKTLLTIKIKITIIKSFLKMTFLNYNKLLWRRILLLIFKLDIVLENKYFRHQEKSITLTPKHEHHYGLWITKQKLP